MKKFGTLLLGVLLGVLLLVNGSAKADEVTVNNWGEFDAAWRNAATTKITLGQDLNANSGNLSTFNRTASIEIAGNGHQINLVSATASLRLNNPGGTGNNPIFNAHDLSIIDNRAGVQGFMYSNESGSASQWTVQMRNLTYKQTFTAGQRFATVGGAKVRLSGNINIQTNYENFVGAQDIELADNTKYYGVSNASSNNGGQASGGGAGPVSVWYMTSTDGDGHITIGHNAIVSLVNYHTNNTFSPIYYRFGTVTVQSGATLNLNGGTAGINWYLNNSGAGNFVGGQGHYDVESDATLSVSSNTPGGGASVIDYGSTTGTGNQGIRVASQGNLFVLGAQRSGVPLVAMNGGNPNQYLTLNNPKAFDINNQGSRNNGAVNVVRGSFSINASNITLWDNGLNTTTDAASSAFTQVGTFTNSGATVTSSHAGLQTAYRNNATARISGLNQPIEMYVQPWAKTPDTNDTTMLAGTAQNGLIWDTDKTFRVRVAMGELPVSGKPDPNTGQLTYQTVWAVKDQVQVAGTDSLNKAFSEGTDANGYVTVTNDYTQKATANGGDLISFSGKFGDSEETVTADVLDKSAPMLALTTKPTADAKIAGTTDKAEAGATITAKVSHDNGATWVAVSNTTTVDADGAFTLGEISGLAKGDKVQIFVTDAAGNTSPATATTIHDVDFPASPSYEVNGELSHPYMLAWQDKFTGIDFGSHALKYGDKNFAALENTSTPLSVSTQNGAGKSWQVTATMTKELTSADGGSVLHNALVFKQAGQAAEPLALNQQIVVANHTNTSSDETTQVNANWNQQDTGLFFDVPATMQVSPTSYSGNIVWGLRKTPENN